jgi:hypothetical protein
MRPFMALSWAYASVLSQKFECFQRAIEVLLRGVTRQQWWFHW